MSHTVAKEGLNLYNTIPTFDIPYGKAFQNILGKEEDAGKQHFLLFPQCLLSYQRQKSQFNNTYTLTCNLLSANAFNLDQAKVLLVGKES